MKFGDVPGEGARFSADRRYRFALWRTLGPTLPLLPVRRIGWIGLNPSTADENIDDPTVRRCIGFGLRLGFSHLTMLNAFSFRSTDPAQLQPDPAEMRAANDAAIAEGAARCEVVVCCWGVHADRVEPGRGAAIVDMVRRNAPAAKLVCLGVNVDGSPKHPLYLPNASTFRPYPGARA